MDQKVPGVYVSVAVAGQQEGSPGRMTMKAVARLILELGYEVLDQHVFLPTQEMVWTHIAQHIDVPFNQVAREPLLVCEYDLSLLRSPHCAALIADVSEHSYGVGAELQAGWERLESDDTFSVLVLAQAKTFSERMRSCFIGRFRREPFARTAGYETVEHALAIVRRFLQECVPFP